MPRWPGLDQHRLLGTTQVGDKTVYMIESTPRDPATSSYGKRIQWITQDDGLPIKIEYYDEDMTLLKTQTLTWRRVGDAWLWDRITAVNNVTGAKTVLEQTDMLVDVGLSDSLFTKRALSLGAKAFENRVKKEIARPATSQ
jgi:negative regulator of sigma E activity